MKKTEVPGIYKQKEGVLVNKDNLALLQYKKKKQQTQKMDFIEEEVSQLRSELSEIKELLQRILVK